MEDRLINRLTEPHMRRIYKKRKRCDKIVGACTDKYGTCSPDACYCWMDREDYED